MGNAGKYESEVYKATIELPVGVRVKSEDALAAAGRATWRGDACQDRNVDPRECLCFSRIKVSCTHLLVKIRGVALESNNSSPARFEQGFGDGA